MGRHVFALDPARVPGLDPGAVLRLDGPEGRHAALVRRVRVGEEVELVDGLGSRVAGTVVATAKESVDVSVTSLVVEPAPTPRLVVAQALVKGDRGELAVELMTEVGVDEVLPWAASRCVVRWDGERGAKAHARWVATARESGKQARRARFPVVAPLHGTADLRARVAAAPLALVLHEEGEVGLDTVRDALLQAPEVLLVVGPEGGVATEELASLTAAGARVVRLGASVLRSSTAGAAAAAAVQVLAGRW